jgi:hypothetical protein
MSKTAESGLALWQRHGGDLDNIVTHRVCRREHALDICEYLTGLPSDVADSDGLAFSSTERTPEPKINLLPRRLSSRRIEVCRNYNGVDFPICEKLQCALDLISIVGILVGCPRKELDVQAPLRL